MQKTLLRLPEQQRIQNSDARAEHPTNTSKFFLSPTTQEQPNTLSQAACDPFKPLNLDQIANSSAGSQNSHEKASCLVHNKQSTIIQSQTIAKLGHHMPSSKPHQHHNQCKLMKSPYSGSSNAKRGGIRARNSDSRPKLTSQFYLRYVLSPTHFLYIQNPVIIKPVYLTRISLFFSEISGEQACISNQEQTSGGKFHPHNNSSDKQTESKLVKAFRFNSEMKQGSKRQKSRSSAIKSGSAKRSSRVQAHNDNLSDEENHLPIAVMGAGFTPTSSKATPKPTCLQTSSPTFNLGLDSQPLLLRSCGRTTGDSLVKRLAETGDQNNLQSCNKPPTSTTPTLKAYFPSVTDVTCSLRIPEKDTKEIRHDIASHTSSSGLQHSPTGSSTVSFSKQVQLQSQSHFAEVDCPPMFPQNGEDFEHRGVEDELMMIDDSIEQQDEVPHFRETSKVSLTIGAVDESMTNAVNPDEDDDQVKNNNKGVRVGSLDDLLLSEEEITGSSNQNSMEEKSHDLATVSELFSTKLAFTKSSHEILNDLLL